MALTERQTDFLKLALGISLSAPPESAFVESSQDQADVAAVIGDLKRGGVDHLEGAAGRLAEIETLMTAGQVADAQEAADALELDVAAGRPPSNVAFQKLRLRWQNAKRDAARDLDSLQQAVTQEFDDAEAASGAKRLEEVIAGFNVGLSDALDDIINTEHGSKRTEACRTAGRIVGRYLDFVFDSPMVGHVQANPFMAVDVEAILAQPLQLLEIELAKDGT